MRIAVYGAGALGAYYGARLSEHGHEVALIARGEHLAAIRGQGLRILSPDGDLHLQDLQASDDPAAIGPVELVIVAVKSWHIPEVAAAMGPLLGPETMVLPFLNGVEAPDQLAEVIGASHVLGGLSKIFSLIESPGVIRHFKPGAYVGFGELDGSVSPRVQRIKTLFEQAGIDAEAVSDVRTELWKKLLMVSSWAGLGALARSPMGVMRGMPETRALIDASMSEGIAVGRARGHAVDEDYKQSLWAFYEQIPDEGTASMQRDLIAGRPSELDAWNGAIVRFGEQCAVPTPVHRFTYHTLLPLERKARGLI
ncbi:MAG: 2-dehydropantoate 2-reductase [Gammaproteobacteria bacterium]|nr:2-dehydropantoate 2-reductase [Gammaproteobacteria bacterium]